MIRNSGCKRCNDVIHIWFRNERKRERQCNEIFIIQLIVDWMCVLLCIHEPEYSYKLSEQNDKKIGYRLNVWIDFFFFFSDTFVWNYLLLLLYERVYWRNRQKHWPNAFNGKKWKRGKIKQVCNLIGLHRWIVIFRAYEKTLHSRKHFISLIENQFNNHAAKFNQKLFFWFPFFFAFIFIKCILQAQPVGRLHSQAWSKISIIYNYVLLFNLFVLHDLFSVFPNEKNKENNRIGIQTTWESTRLTVKQFKARIHCSVCVWWKRRWGGKKNEAIRRP